ncbi:MAG TPA: potassium-transporting ATPase subunit C [Acidimicrobiales bacterium]|nr:potassium-transporting ATPase subunit C [Acidimicrobiales bacterium]
MLLNLRRAILASTVFFLVLGLAYGLAGTAVSQVLFPHQANGSLTSYGSTLIGQNWPGPEWFQGRPSATVNAAGHADPYDAMASGAANLGPRSKALEEAVARRAALLRKEGITPTSGLVTSSGSGLDPDISPGDAYAQVVAVARARHLQVATVRAVVASHVVGPQLGFLGAPYVNVLALNVALSRLG